MMAAVTAALEAADDVAADDVAAGGGVSRIPAKWGGEKPNGRWR